LTNVWFSQVRFHPRLDEISAEAWDALRPDDNPFLSYAFLSGLERSGSLRAEYGWRAHHLGLYKMENWLPPPRCI